MQRRIFLTLRIFLLLLILPLLGIAFAPPVKISAACPVSGNQPIQVENGLVSVIQDSNINPQGTTVNCITGQPASIPQFSIQSYDDIKKLYFDQAKSSYNKITIQNNQPPAPPIVVDGKLYRIVGDLTLNSDLTVNETGVIFVDGNLYINNNLTNNDPKKGVVFIVKGTIYIARTVEKVNAFLIAYGKNASDVDLTTPFCSAYDPTDGCRDFSETPDTEKAKRKQLIVQGSVISLNKTTSPLFVRRFNNPVSLADPAEIINYEPKYLVVMKDIFSRDLKIWREIQ